MLNAPCRPGLVLSFLVCLLGLPDRLSGAEASQGPGRTPPFILGADISWIPEDESKGAEYYAKGVRKDIVALLREHGFNYVRLRLFVNPKSASGYARLRSEAFNDLSHTLAMARRVKEAGMGLLLAFHYSDGWADPEHQNKPSDWEKLSFPELVEAVENHTREVLEALKANGTTPDMVQIGNEITHGILWPEGRVGSKVPTGNAQTDRTLGQFTEPENYDRLAALLKAGIATTRQVDPAIKIMLHHHLGRHNERVREWMDHLLSRGMEFDVIGLSCYAQGKEGDWEQCFRDLAARYPKHSIVVAEYSARKRYLNDLVHAIPERKGLGTFIWEPTRHREALFDKEGKNAGGGQAANFVGDLSVNQGATTATVPPRPADGFLLPGEAAPATTPRPVRPPVGGRYEGNEYLNLYPQMAHDYAGPGN